MSNISKAESYLNGLLKGSRNESRAVVVDFLAENHSVNELYEEIIKPALYQVGTLWEQNKITVADEHLATAITEGILNELYPMIIPKEYLSRKVVLACVDKEEHQVGIKMVADVFEQNGWESFFLGTGFPVDELVKFIEKVKPQVLALSLSVYFNFKSFKNMVDTIRNYFPELPVLVGGQAFNHMAEGTLGEIFGVKYISDLKQLENYILNFN